MANLPRGEVYWADLNPVRGSEQSGIRPVLILSLPRASWVKISQVRTISIDRIGKRVGEVDAVELSPIVDGLTELIT